MISANWHGIRKWETGVMIVKWVIFVQTEKQ